MKKTVALLLLFSFLLSLVGCLSVNGISDMELDNKNDNQLQSNDDFIVTDSSKSAPPTSRVKMADVELDYNEKDVNKAETNTDDSFVMIAKITRIDEKILVEVIESKYASGAYLVLTSSDTLFYDKNGNEIKRGQIKAGDIVILTYTGQVMLSLPPQIIALTITKTN